MCGQVVSGNVPRETGVLGHVATGHVNRYRELAIDDREANGVPPVFNNSDTPATGQVAANTGHDVQHNLDRADKLSAATSIRRLAQPLRYGQDAQFTQETANWEKAMVGNLTGIMVLIVLLALAINSFATRERSMVVLGSGLAVLSAFTGLLLITGFFRWLGENLYCTTVPARTRD